MFIGGTPFRYLALAGFAGVALLGGLIMHDPERLSRIISFLDPGKYADDEAYQLVNSLYGIMDGGLLGKGIGQGMLKRDYLPEAHTDFILAIIGEETGLLGMLAVMGAYLVFFAGGMRIAWECRDTFARLLAYGITLLITLQAGINIGVVTGSMPTKGLPLPFISYGGSNLVIMVAMVGILLRIARGEGDPDARRSVRDANQWI
jgi:cell division protein FtsW